MRQLSTRPLRVILVAVLTATATISCTDGDDEGAAPSPGVRTVTETVTVTETETVLATSTPSPRATATRGEDLAGELLGTAWTVEVVEDGGELCLVAEAAEETDQVCGAPVELDPRTDQEAAPEQISAVVLEVANLAITTGLVIEPVAQVRIESEPPPEDPEGGAIQLVEPVDALVGFNAYADADEAGGPLGIARVVALDASDDEIATVEPES